MTPIEARVQYKMDTGKYPMWPEDLESNKRVSLKKEKWGSLNITTKPDDKTFFGFKFKTEYGHWLEERLGDVSNLRDEFFRATGDRAVTLKSNTKFWESLRSTYTEWLEERYINKNHA